MLIHNNDLQMIHGQIRNINHSRAPLVQYVPDRVLHTWLRRISRMLFIFFLTAIVMMVIVHANPQTFGCVISFFKWILLPIKPFVLSSSVSDKSVLLSILTTVAPILNWLMVPVVVLLSVKAMDAPYFLAFENGTLLFLSPAAESPSALTHNSGYAGLVVSKRLDLAKMSSLTVERPKGTKSVNDYVVCLKGDFAPNFAPIRIRWGDIATEGERQLFLQSITTAVPTADLSLFEPFKQLPQKHSYTELWLKELSGAPKRDKLTQLADGAELEDGNYKIVRKAGIGGHGTVYIAESRKHGNRLVVLKEFVLPLYPDIRVRKNAAERFQAEATMLSALTHNQIATFIELFIEDHRAYLVMELVEGDTLKDVVSTRGPMPEAEVLRLAAQTCEILIYLHSQDPPVLHRDLTPDNIMIEDTGLVKLIDFSVAEEASSGVTGSVVGKPNYISPEQFRGKPTIASDIYSFGATLYYLLLGDDPPPITVLHPSLIDEKISAELDAIISKCTQLKIESRYSSFRDVLEDLKKLTIR